MNRRERTRLESSLLVLAGLYHTSDQWTRVLLPFFQWKLVPHVEFHTVVMLSALGAVVTGFGSFIVAQCIESLGVKKTAIISTIATATYQVLVSQIDNYYLFIGIQSLLLFNHMPMVIDAVVCQMEGEDGDDKKRTRMLGRITIPQSISYAMGPYLALQMLFLLSSSVQYSQIACGLLHFLTILPVICVALPDHETRKMQLPSIFAYWEILKQERTRLCLILLMMVVGPYTAYDQVIRAQLSSAIIPNPANMVHVFMILGGTTLVINLFVIHRLQAKFTPQQLLLGAFIILTGSYVWLSMAVDYYHLLVGLCVQVAVVAVAVGELSSQVLSTIGKCDSGKVAALLRTSHLISAAMTPIITGFYVDQDELPTLCYCSAAISAIGIPIVAYFGRFMKTSFAHLPMSMSMGSGKLD